MKKSNREINIFSMSTLDLFASAMGAFILITLVLFPYVLNTGDSEESDSEAQEAEAKAQFEKQVAEVKAQFEKRVAEAKAQLKSQLEAQVEALQQPVPKTDDSTGGDSDEQLAEVKAEYEGRIEAIEEQIEGLQEQIDSTPVLLGIRTLAKKFVFVVDMSGSLNLTDPMYHGKYPDGRDHRQSMITSIETILANFKTGIELAMIGFHVPDGYNVQLHYWPTDGTYFRVRKNTRSRERVVSQLKTWMGLVYGGTPTLEALREALALNPEEIILLTDGQPDDDWRSVVDTITRLNTRKIPIHGIAVGDYLAHRELIDFLVELTNRNGGSLVAAKPG